MSNDRDNKRKGRSRSSDRGITRKGVGVMTDVTLEREREGVGIMTEA